MKRRLQHECDLVPISPEQLRNANDLIKTVTFTKKPQERTMAKKMFEKGMAELADCRESRRCKRSDEAKQLLKLQKVRQEQMDKATGLMVKAKKAAIFERPTKPPEQDVTAVGKRAKATISPPSASKPLQPAAFDDNDSSDDCDMYPFVLEATAVSEPK